MLPTHVPSHLSACRAPGPALTQEGLRDLVQGLGVSGASALRLVVEESPPAPTPMDWVLDAPGELAHVPARGPDPPHQGLRESARAWGDHGLPG